MRGLAATRICWPKILVRTLGVPVLVVLVDGSAVEVEIWSNAASPPVRRRWPDDIKGSRGGSVRIDVARLAPFLRAARQARGPVVIPNADTATLSRRALAAVAERLELESPILAGRLNGYRLAFAKPPRLRA